MAKADDTSSTIDWIWLCDALVLATALLGSVALAKEQLREWLAAGELPWSCTRWKGLDAEGLAEKKRQKLDAERLAKKRRKQGNGVGGIIYSLPSAAYCSGDPRFWRATLWIDWEANDADERRRHGAQAFGIRVSREHLLALLPEESREREEVRGAGAWIAAEAKKMKAANKIPPDIEITDFARELENRMRKAAASDKSLRPIQWRSIKNKLPEWGLWPVTSIN